MKTFFESLIRTKNVNLLNELIFVLEDSNINVKEFLDWYVEEGMHHPQQDTLIEGIFDRFSSGQHSGQSVQNVFPRLQRFGKRIGTTAQRAGEFVGRQIGRARDAADSFSSGIDGIAPHRKKPQQQSGERQQYLPGMDPRSNTGSSQSSGGSDVVNRTRATLEELSKRYNTSSELKNLINDQKFGEVLYNLIQKMKELKLESYIRNNLLLLSENGLDVENLVEWFAQERVKVNEGVGSWFQKAGNWLSGQWQNLKHAWNTWGDGDKKNSSQRNKQAVENALKALQELKQKHGSNLQGEFLNLLDPILNKLSTIQSGVSNVSAAPDSASSVPGVDIKGNAPQPNPSDSSSASSDLKPEDGVAFNPNLKDKNTSDAVAVNPYVDTEESWGKNTGWMGSTDTTHQDYVGRSHSYQGRQPKPGVRKPPEGWPKNPGNSSFNVGAGIPSLESSTEHESDENKKFLESLLPKENKFSWFG